MKPLLITSNLEGGGAQKAMLKLARGLLLSSGWFGKRMLDRDRKYVAEPAASRMV